MHWNSAVFWIFICTILTAFGRRGLFETKCKRKCNTEDSSINCWKETTDGFTYGLSTAMIDYCQVILKLRNLTAKNVSWYNISRDILANKIREYELNNEVKQLTKENIEQIAINILDKCFNSSSTLPSIEPSCSSCSKSQVKVMKQWGLSSIILISIGSFLVLIIFLSYSLHSHHIRRSYISF